MKKRRAVFLTVFLLAGCKESDADLRFKGSTEAGQNATIPVETAPEVNVVTGEPATTEDKQVENAETSDDKLGAVALKVEY